MVSVQYTYCRKFFLFLLFILLGIIQYYINVVYTVYVVKYKN
jgi:hypothetical protein